MSIHNDTRRMGGSACAVTHATGVDRMGCAALHPSCDSAPYSKKTELSYQFLYQAKVQKLNEYGTSFPLSTFVCWILTNIGDISCQ